MKLTRENRSTRGKTCPSITLSTANPTWTDPGSNPMALTTIQINQVQIPLSCAYRVAHEKVSPPTDEPRPGFSSNKHNHVITAAPRAAGMPRD